MGKHFDTLVEMVNKHVMDDEGNMFLPDVKNYLKYLIKKCALFEFPLTSDEIFPRTGKGKEEYSLYLKEYFDLCKENGHFFVTPFRLTAVEDNDSVVFLDNIEWDRYKLTSCANHKAEGAERWVVFCADIRIGYPKGDCGFKINTMPTYIINLENGKRVPDDKDVVDAIPKCVVELKNCLGIEDFKHPDGKRYPLYLNPSEREYFANLLGDVVSSSVAYIEEVIYIMDRKNFIIEKEHRDSVIQTERLAKKTRKKQDELPQSLRKTVMRPHYIFLSEEDTVDFFRGHLKEPRAIHIVRVHPRTFRADRYVNMKGKTIFIPQHYRGVGRIENLEGYIYQVMLKKGFGKIEAYNNKR